MADLTIRAVRVTLGAILLDGKNLSIAVYDQMPTEILSDANIDVYTPMWRV